MNFWKKIKKSLDLSKASSLVFQRILNFSCLLNLTKLVVIKANDEQTTCTTEQLP